MNSADNSKQDRIEVTCPKCDGRKTITGFSHYDNGRCFRCMGNGTVMVKRTDYDNAIAAGKAIDAARAADPETYMVIRHLTSITNPLWITQYIFRASELAEARNFARGCQAEYSGAIKLVRITSDNAGLFPTESQARRAKGLQGIADAQADYFNRTPATRAA